MNKEELDKVFNCNNASIEDFDTIVKLVKFVNENLGYRSLLDKINPKYNYLALYPHIVVFDKITKK